MQRINHPWTLFSIVILAVSAGWIAWTSIVTPAPTGGQTPAARKGFLAPDFELSSLEGETLRLSQLAGKPVLVNFWASWCPPCKAEMPDLQRIHEEFGPQGFIILGINAANQDSLQAASDFTRQEGLEFPILLDTDGGVARQYMVQALPTSYFIGRDGIVQDVVIGGPMPEAFLRAQAEKLLREER